MSSTYFVENLNVSADSTLGGDIVFTNVTNNLTVDVAAQATGTATVTVPDLGGVAGQLLAPLLAAGTDERVLRMNGTTGLQESSQVLLSDTGAFSDVLGVSAQAGQDLSLTAAAGQDVVVAVDAGQNLTVTGGGATIAQDLLVSGDAVINGDLTVNGTTTSVDSTNVLIADNNMLLSSNYTNAVAREGGIAVNYLPTAVASVSANSNFSPLSVDVASNTGFAANDIILVSGAANPSNNGLYQVASVSVAPLNLIFISPAPTFNFLNNTFTADPTDAGVNVTKVTVAVLQAGTDGRFEVASGSDTSLTFTDLALTSELPSGTWTEVDIATTDATPNVTNIATTSDRSTTFELVYAAKEDGANNALNGKITKAFNNSAGTNSAVGMGTRDESVLADGSNWALSVTGSGANIVLTLTGEAATDIDWRLLYRATESPSP